MYDLNLADSDILVDVSHQTQACTQGFQYDRKGCGEEIMVEQGELRATDSLKTPPGTRNMCKLNLIEPDTSLDECNSLQAQDVTPVQWSNLQYDRGRGRDIGHSVAHKDYYQASSKDRYHWRGSIFHKLRDHPQGSHNFTAGSNVHDLEDWFPESYDHSRDGKSDCSESSSMEHGGDVVMSDRLEDRSDDFKVEGSGGLPGERCSVECEVSVYQ